METRQQLAEKIAELCDVHKINGFQYMSKVELLGIYNRCCQQKTPIRADTDADTDDDDDDNNDDNLHVEPIKKADVRSLLRKIPEDDNSDADQNSGEKKIQKKSTARVIKKPENMDVYNSLMSGHKKMTNDICSKLKKNNKNDSESATEIFDEYVSSMQNNVNAFKYILDIMGADESSYLFKHSMDVIDNSSDRVYDLYEYFA